MKAAILLLLLLTLFAVPVSGQHKIGLYADSGHATTEAVDGSPGVLTVYVVHEGAAQGATAAFFSIVPSTGFTGVWTDETSAFQFMGASPTGLSLSYGQFCLNGPVSLLEVHYAVFGTSEECSFLQAVAHPDVDVFGGAPVIVDCDFEDVPAVGGRLTINPTTTCSPVPVEPSTWGRVKALYR